MRHTVSLVEASYERKDRVRDGKVQRRKKVSSKDGYKMSDGKSKRMSNKERRNRSRSQTKASRKRKGSQGRASRRRKVSMRKRKSRLGESSEISFNRAMSQGPRLVKKGQTKNLSDTEQYIVDRYREIMKKNTESGKRYKGK